MSSKRDKNSADEASGSKSESAQRKEDDERYVVGYKNPPKATQFKKGTSGNSKGRKKKKETEDIRIVMEEVLGEPVKVRERGRERIVSREEAIMHAELMNALDGAPKSIEALFKRAQRCGLFSKAQFKSLIIFTEPEGDDGKIVRMYFAEQDALRKAAEDYYSGPIRSYKSS